MQLKPRAFWFHYNKPLSAKRKKPILTIHYAGACHFVESIQTIDCDTVTRIRRVQPRCVIAGCGIVDIKRNKAVIYGSVETLNLHKALIQKAKRNGRRR